MAYLDTGGAAQYASIPLFMSWTLDHVYVWRYKKFDGGIEAEKIKIGGMD